MNNQPTLRAPFPWFGGKSRAAHLVWERFGDVPNYVEPFFGSGAVLLSRPHSPRVETVNDADAYLTNFWRALQAEPDAVARAADWPVNEVDLAARRDRLFAGREEFTRRMWTDPNYYDAEAAGIWVWGVCSTIGNAWQPKSTHLGAGMGVHRARTHLGDAGRGAAIREYLGALSIRLERVRVMCGDWTRVTSPTVTTHQGMTGVFLDPPYAAEGQTGAKAYMAGDASVAGAVWEWAVERGEDPLMRIALCGYEGEHDMPPDWECVAWSAKGGYETRSGSENRRRERIWFSPYCLKAELF